MAVCLKAPTVPVPQLPAPLSLAPPSPPSLPTIPGLCCKMPPILPPLPPIPIPALILNPAVIATLNAFIATALGFVNSLAIPCPLE
jgi:hypothetical protein